MTVNGVSTIACGRPVFVYYKRVKGTELTMVTTQPRIINGISYDMPTVDGYDRCQINTRLHYLNVEIDKLRAKQAALIAMRDQLDRHNEMQEMGNLFDEMFGG